MKRHAKNNRGFTLIELMMVVTIVGVLASIAIPSYLNYIQKARSAQCHVDRGEVQNIIIQYYNDHSDTELQSLQQLVDEGYLHSGSNCPLGGEYVLIPGELVGTQYPVVACSLHYLPKLISEPTPEPTPEPIPGPIPIPVPAPEPTPVPTPKPTPKPLTSLGSSFEEITQSMMDLIEKYYQENGKYPRTGAKNKYTDVGLDPNEWKDAINGIIYTPQGNRILIEPGEGYTFSVTSEKGKEIVVSGEKNTSLKYSVEAKQWYYNNIKKGNEVDISTLRVTQQK
jgi:prepilin-type N-terminal cleavage/methylation domain-containing protein